MAAEGVRKRFAVYAIRVGVIASLAVIMAANVEFLLSAREDSRAASVRWLDNLARSIQQSVATEIAERTEDIDNAAAFLASGGPGLPDMSGRLARSFGSFTAFDPQGRVTASVASEFPPGDYTQEPFFRAVQNSPDASVHVTAGMVAQAPDIALVLSRHLEAGSAGYGGVLATTVGHTRLDGILKHFDLGDGGTVSILTEDGRLLSASRPAMNAGLDLSKSEAYRHVAEFGVGSFDAASMIDGRHRVYATRKITGAPLLLFVGTSLDTVYEPFRSLAKLDIAAAAVLALLIAGATIGGRHELRRRRESEHAAEMAAIAARRSEGLVTVYFENLAHGVLGIRVQPDGGLSIERVNANAQRLFGVAEGSTGSLLGRDPREVFGASVSPEFVPQLQHCLETRRPSQRTLPFNVAGRMYSLRVTVTPVHDETSGAIGLLLASLEDVTFHEIAQAKLLHTHRMNGIERIASGVANEFNNLLQSMIGHLEMLAEEVDGCGTAALHARSAMDAAARGTRLTQGLLSSSSQQLLQPESVIPERKLARMSRSFEAKRDPRVRLVTIVEPGTPPVHADAGHLQSALLNLCENAQEAMLPRGGTVTVRASFRDGVSPNGTGANVRFVVFSVTDDGCGMTPDIMARAREPFFTTKGERFRSGLGLSMVDGFARQSGGELTLESLPGNETTVELLLPAADPMVMEDDLAPLSRPVRVLVVDDAADQLGMLEELLRDEGCQVTALAGSREASEALRSGARYDILITDYVMPGANGMELIEDAFRQQPGIRALLITGTPDAPTSASVPGSLSVLRKPFRADQLLRQVRRMARAMEHTALIG